MAVLGRGVCTDSFGFFFFFLSFSFRLFDDFVYETLSGHVSTWGFLLVIEPIVTSSQTFSSLGSLDDGAI